MARAASLLKLGAFIGAVLLSITLLHRLGPGEAAPRLHWQVSTQSEHTQYQSAFSAAPGTGAQALYVQSYSGHSRAYLNGTLLTEWQRHATVPALGGAEPLLLVLPESLLREGENSLRIEQARATYARSFVGASYLGSEAQLAPHHAQRRLLKHTLPIGIIIATLVLASLSLTLWLRRRQDHIYGWHVLTCLTGSLYCALPLSPLALPSVWLDALLLLLFLWFVVAAAWLGLCLATTPQPVTWRRTRWAVGAGSALVLLAALWLPALPLRAAVPLLYMGIIAIGAYTTSTVFWRQYFQRWDGTAFWMLGAVMCICVVALHDGALLLGLIAPDDGFWLVYGAPPPIVVFTAILLRRFVQALSDAEQLNRELEQRVAAREAEIARSYQALQRAESERVISAERERLFGDLHDGLGGTLVATLSRLSNEGAGDTLVAQGVQSALEDLRLTLDSLNPDERSLRAVLAPLRERLANTCADAGIALRFDLTQLSDDFELPRPHTLHLLRIVQEAAMNAVRHAQGKNLRIALNRLPGQEDSPAQLEVLIDDDGQGLPATGTHRPGHYGLATLRRRAAQCGGQIEWLPLQPGTRVRVVVPLV